MPDILKQHQLAAGRERHTLDLFRLDNRVALVTGGAGRIGTLISRGLAEMGARVIVASRDVAKNQKLVEELQGRGLSASAYTLDQRDEVSILTARDVILKQYEKIDILVNNAVARAGSTLEATTVEQWEESMRCNATGLFLMSKIFAEPMIEQKSGCILNVASIAGVVAPDFRIYGQTGRTSPIDYSFAKGGMLALTRHLATYLAPHHIRVNAISPGGFYSGKQTAEFLESYSARVPMRRMAVENDIKGTVAFLCSDAAAYITGQNLVVDGGLTAW